MSRLRPNKLHVRFLPPTTAEGPLYPRCYTLTHSDATGDLYLTIGPEYDRQQLAGLQTRLMRDEVIAEWLEGEGDPTLHLYCHISGGVVMGPAGWRYQIFQRELPLVLEALRYGDRQLFAIYPDLDQASIQIHFQAVQKRYRRVESWGVPGDYRIGGS